MLDSVMRWIFISNGFENAGSDWHVDPIGSAAFMLMIAGKKRWFLADNQFTTILGPGDFLIVPPGMSHKIENIGSELNVAISHNWVPSSGAPLMWAEVERAISLIPQGCDVLETIERLNNEGKIDNLLMGLLMVIFESPELVPRFPRSLVESVSFKSR